MKKFCLVVDPYSSHAALNAALIANNIIPIAISTSRPNLSVEEMETLYKDYAYVFKYSEHEYENLLQELSAFSIVRVIAGDEGSVDIADKLAAHFTPQLANPPASSKLRMNKFDMQEATRAAGLNAVKQMKVFNPVLTEEQKQLLSRWKFPVIVKPNNSAASLNVSFCSDLSDVDTALSEIIGKPHGFSATIMDCAVIQECLRGTEYFVDTVSLMGKTFIASVQHYHKILFNNRNIYRYIEIDDPNTLATKKCMSYVTNVLKATELNNGFGHTELFLTPEPYLIEINARISGCAGLPNKLAFLCTGENQATLMVKSIKYPEQFLEICERPSLPLKQYGRMLLLQNWSPRTIGELDLQKLRSFSSYRECLQLKKAGTDLDLPQSLMDTVSLVLLVNSSYEQMVTDSEAIFELEQANKLF